jgi:imidazolonepropionase-like amidohydrolase
MSPNSSTFTLHDVRALEQDGGFSEETDVVVEDGVVTRIGPGVKAPDGALTYDLRGLWLMPGVFDCHAHMASSTVDERELLRTPLSYSTLETAVNLRKTLDAGVTFVRDAGGADAGVKRAVEEGLVTGPRLQVAIILLSQTGGHGDSYSERVGVDPDPVLGHLLTTVDGVDDMRVTVRRLLRDGADCIKLCTSGGVVSPHDTPWDTSFTAEEIATAVFEAGRRGKPVMSHAIAGEGIDLAVAGGIRSIEHGTMLTESQAEAMAAAGCWLVPTLSIVNDLIDTALAQRSEESVAAPSYAIKKVLELRDSFGECVRIARAAGVRIASGCDWIDRRQHGRNLEELALLHEAGLTVEETLLAATSNGAELCGVGDRYGRIAPGYVFDAVVLGRDPSDMAVFRDKSTVREVFKGGVACRSDGDLLAERGPAPVRAPKAES